MELASLLINVVAAISVVGVYMIVYLRTEIPALRRPQRAVVPLSGVRLSYREERSASRYPCDSFSRVN
jgi:hypothetical protein